MVSSRDCGVLGELRMSAPPIQGQACNVNLLWLPVGILGHRSVLVNGRE